MALKYWVELKSWREFYPRLAGARSFCFQDEIRALEKAGLIKGGDLRNAVVVSPDGVLLTNGRPAAPDEPARHKLLDLIGDLYVLGRPLKAKIIARATGHRENAELVKYLQKHLNTL